MDDKINLDALDTAKGGEAGYELELKAPDGRTLPGRLKIRGYDSASYHQKLEDQNRLRFARGEMGKRPTVEELEADTLELAAVLIVGWTCPFSLEGKPLEYSSQNAALLMRRFRWIREQVDRAAGARANFLPGSSTS